MATLKYNLESITKFDLTDLRLLARYDFEFRSTNIRFGLDKNEL